MHQLLCEDPGERALADTLPSSEHSLPVKQLLGPTMAWDDVSSTLFSKRLGHSATLVGSEVYVVGGLASTK